MLIPVLLFIVGLLCLIKGGDWFVDGATGIARRFHVPELLIGATVVSIGTTLPEVMVSTTSALTGHGEIAYGNAIGSVICNSALIAAITIAVRPGKVDPKSLRTPVAFFFVAAAFYAGVAYTTGSFTRPVGLILLAVFVAYIVCNVLAMKNTPAPEEEEQAEEGSFAKELGLLAIGAVLIAVGADPVSYTDLDVYKRQPLPHEHSGGRGCPDGVYRHHFCGCRTGSGHRCKSGSCCSQHQLPHHHQIHCAGRRRLQLPQLCHRAAQCHGLQVGCLLREPDAG